MRSFLSQRHSSRIAILTESEHMQEGNNLIWHILGEESKIDRAVFDKQRSAFWMSMASILVRKGVMNMSLIIEALRQKPFFISLDGVTAESIQSA